MSKFRRLRLGATGEFPRGKIHSSDEGELRLGIAWDETQQVVIINFGKPIVWIGLPPDVARALATKILEHADRERPKS